MDVRRKLEILADAAKYDASCASSGSKRPSNGERLGSTQGMGICHSYTPDGRCVSLLKVLLTNVCLFDCQFCVNRVSSDIPRARFTPKELADLTLSFYQRNYIEGLFLSSGIVRSPDFTMEQMNEVARRLRIEHRFGGYIHLKVVPGASKELIAAAGRLADRLSANIELPTQRDLDELAPAKRMPVIRAAMQDIQDGVDEALDSKKARRPAPAFAPAGQSTQMVIGATPASDQDILTTARTLYDVHRLRRVYYSSYSPVPRASASLPPKSPPLVREHRLYQADWLLRYYGFRLPELFADKSNLDLDIDPKLAWALGARAEFPVNVNTADREQLLRVPGLGVRNVERILTIRRGRQVRLEDLARLRVSLGKVRPFVVTADHVPRDLDLLRLRDRLVPPAEQLDLFAPRVLAS